MKDNVIIVHVRFDAVSIPRWQKGNVWTASRAEKGDIVWICIVSDVDARGDAGRGDENAAEGGDVHACEGV